VVAASSCSAWRAAPLEPPTSKNAELLPVVDELKQVYRTLYALSADSERTQILDGLTGHALPQMRAFGLDLARRTLLNARGVEPKILEKSQMLLMDPSADVRLHAAQLIATRPSETGSRLLIDAIRKEDTDAVAAEILRALSLQPGDLELRSLERWMRKPGVANDAAFAAAISVIASGDEIPTDEREMLGAVIGEFDEIAATPSRIALAWELGIDEYVVSALASEDSDLRMASANALVERTGVLDLVLERARLDQSLFPIALRGIVAHRATADGYRVASTLPATNDDRKQEGLKRIIAAMGPLHLIEIVQAESDLFRRETMLRHIDGPAFTDRLKTDPNWALALEHLIDTRFKLGDCAGVEHAGFTLDGLRPENTTSPSAPSLTTDAPRIECAIVLGKIDEATTHTKRLLAVEGISSSILADAWLAGIQNLGATDSRNQQALDEFAVLFQGILTPDQLDALRVLRESVAAPTPAASE